VERKREGYDLFISDKQFTRAIARRVVDRFGGSFLETSHLVGMKKGNELYRITISVRIPDFQKGDVIKTGEKLFVIEGIKGNTATLQNIITRTKENRKISDIGEFSLLKKGKDVKEVEVIYREGNTAYILDPFNFKERAVTDNGNSEILRVVKIDEEIYVVPS
jgi:nonsense-mediated mRNA decay protein 3